jgi:allantoicase
MPTLPNLIDLASRSHGGRVIAANDETFGAKERLVDPAEPVSYASHTGLTGDLYDGWETRRRRCSGSDWAIVRLGAPGVVRQLVVDTRHFKGQSPTSCTIEMCAVDGFPVPELLLEDSGVTWHPLVIGGALRPDTENRFEVECDLRATHVRLTIHPDGGVARLRALGEAVPDPRRLHGTTFDVVAQAHGGRVVACSDEFFGRPTNINAPSPTVRSEKGWESNRRRKGGHDFIVIELAARSTIQVLEYDTSYYRGNAPEAFSLQGCDATKSSWTEPDAWAEILPLTPGQHDTRHWFRVPPHAPVTHLRLNIFPDGGVSRIRVIGAPDAEGRRQIAHRWLNTLPDCHALSVLAALGVSRPAAHEIVAGRPYSAPEDAVRAIERADRTGDVQDLLALF